VRSLDMNKIAKGLGGKRKGKVKASGGCLGAMQTAAEVARMRSHEGEIKEVDLAIEKHGDDFFVLDKDGPRISLTEEQFLALKGAATWQGAGTPLVFTNDGDLAIGSKIEKRGAKLRWLRTRMGKEPCFVRYPDSDMRGFGLCMPSVTNEYGSVLVYFVVWPCDYQSQIEPRWVHPDSLEWIPAGAL